MSKYIGYITVTPIRNNQFYNFTPKYLFTDDREILDLSREDYIEIFGEEKSKNIELNYNFYDEDVFFRCGEGQV